MPLQPYVPTSHATIHHGSLDNLGQDWSVIGDPGMAPRAPYKVYLPRDAEECARALREAALLGEWPVVRAQAHSSNNLVTAAQRPRRGAVLVTTGMNRVLRVDPGKGTVTVQAGALLSAVDRHLTAGGLGLPVIGDHDDITAGGFASVGGVGPASHRYGLFADNVLAAQYAGPDGELRRCSTEERADELLGLLLGTGRHGVLTELTLRTIPVDKYHTLLRLDRHLTSSLEKFLPRVGALLRAPDPAMRYERVLWLDQPGPVPVRVGEICSYRATTRGVGKAAVDRVGYGYLKSLGFFAGRLPTPIDDALKVLGTIGMFTSPTFATIKNVERFTDIVLSHAVGDPPRWLVSFVPADRFEEFFEQAHALLLAERSRTGAVGEIAMFAKGINSRYLAGEARIPANGAWPPEAGRRFAEIICYFGCRPGRMNPEIFARLVDAFDELTLRCGGYRYLHSPATQEPTRRARLDANTQYLPAKAPQEAERP